MKINNKKTRVVVLGADGMLGNAIFRYLKTTNIDVIGTSRRNNSSYYFFDAERFTKKSFDLLIKDISPLYVINCIGYIRPNGESLLELRKALILNSIFPQNLSIACLNHNVRLIHFSTDCIFSGNDGPYKDSAQSDEKGIYGMTKFLGEVRQLPNITIRTSIIGRELGGKKNLLDWFLSVNEKEINGFKNVYWNGISTVTAAKIVEKIIRKRIDFEQPIIQVASETVSKYELLNIFKDVYKKDIIINKLPDIKSDKTLILSITQKKFFKNLIPSIREQVRELKKFYE